MYSMAVKISSEACSRCSGVSVEGRRCHLSEQHMQIPAINRSAEFMAISPSHFPSQICSADTGLVTIR